MKIKRNYSYRLFAYGKDKDKYQIRLRVTFNGQRIDYSTGCQLSSIDAFFDYRVGNLEWRTVQFEQGTLNLSNFQGNAVVNYTDRETPWTRIIEHKHFESFGNAVYDNPHTVVSREYSTECKQGMVPFYAVNDEHNTHLYTQYKTLADADRQVHFGERLAEYKYYDMAPVIETVMARIKNL